MSVQGLTNGRLSEADIDAYWRDGFLSPIEVFTSDEVAAARTSLEEIERDYLDADLPLPLNTYKRVNAQVVMPFVADIARHPAILDVVEGILA